MFLPIYFLYVLQFPMMILLSVEMFPFFTSLSLSLQIIYASQGKQEIKGGEWGAKAMSEWNKSLKSYTYQNKKPKKYNNSTNPSHQFGVQ